MFFDKRDFEEIKYVLDNLNEPTRKECLKLLGLNFKKEIFTQISEQKEEACTIIKLKKNKLPVGIFGHLEITENVAGVYFLSTKHFYDGVLVSFVREAQRKAEFLEKKYKLLIDTFDKRNTKTRRLLELLGFKSTNKTFNIFEIYYLGELDFLKEVENV